jgi:hypothetical protein
MVGVRQIMSSPHFNQGEIAITVNTKFAENRGKIVRLCEYMGRHDWPGLSYPVHVWLVECLCRETHIHYFYPYHQDLKKANQGQMPELFLRRISTKSMQLVLEFNEFSGRIFDSDVSV